MGEETFRRLEEQLTMELASAERMVLAPGGGWPLRQANVRALPPGSAVLWLRVSAEEAVRRLRGSGAGRPLLMQADPLARAAQLEAERAGRYAEIGWPVETEGREPGEVANEVQRILGDRVKPREPASN
jgi:shikimate kinase